MISSDVLSFRRPTNQDDDVVFQSLVDWVDDLGPWTRDRAQKTLTGYLAENEYAHYPVDPRCSFRETWVIQASGVDVGLVHMHVLKGMVTVESLSIMPAHRGLGYFNHAYRLLAAAAFEIYKVSHLEYEAFIDQPAMTTIRDRHDGAGAETVDTRVSTRGRELVRRRITMEQWQTRKDGLMGVLPWTIDWAAVDAAQATFLDCHGRERSRVYTDPLVMPVENTLNLRFSVSRPPENNVADPSEIP